MREAVKKPARRPRGKLRRNDARHGTSTGYFHWGCRCEACRGWVSDYVRTRRAHRKANLDKEIHGRVSTYHNAGCRCVPCTNAFTEYRAGRDRIKNGDKMDLSTLA